MAQGDLGLGFRVSGLGNNPQLPPKAWTLAFAECLRPSDVTPAANHRSQ